MKFVVGSVADVVNVIIPHFDTFPLQGSKHLNFLAFKEAAMLLSTGGHRTDAG